MSDTEVSFRAALHDEQFATAAVLLAQLMAARHTQRGTFSFVQDMRLQRHCLDLVTQRSVSGADALLQAAAQWSPL
ncbi:hypothetical protein MUN84_00595 [Hymenobacter sp. 5516J-16]|uniref:Uncharacterized protein n=1 Tax=Hymenobacter sublimis TaxID=2933777 RepID=A0ABY4JDQ3_9BACT|nr:MULTISPECIES: hypothetical protein [Hymenobacter]UOQ77272.1 hypothetical protein MUN84_00595 [Hymenobacter sp. 5516J-16]UPL50946.1 hypothetical protein MWH26_08585 [Hymenobacter sublimis]